MKILRREDRWYLETLDYIWVLIFSVIMLSKNKSNFKNQNNSRENSIVKMRLKIYHYSVWIGYITTEARCLVKGSRRDATQLAVKSPLKIPNSKLSLKYYSKETDPQMMLILEIRIGSLFKSFSSRRGAVENRSRKKGETKECLRLFARCVSLVQVLFNMSWEKLNYLF